MGGAMARRGDKVRAALTKLGFSLDELRDALAEAPDSDPLAWIPVPGTPGRYTRGSRVGYLLVAAGAVLELHRHDGQATVHRYRPDPAADPADAVGSPLDGQTCIDSVDVPQLAAADDATVW